MPYSMAQWLVDFNEVLETSIDTVRKSVDGTKTFVKYVGEMPPSVAAIEDKSREFSYPEIMAIKHIDVSSIFQNHCQKLSVVTPKVQKDQTHINEKHPFYSRK